VRTSPGTKQQYREPDHSAEGIRRRQATANKILAVLKAALNFAWREGRVSSDVAWRRVRPFASVDIARMRYFTVPECKRLIAAAPPDFRRLVQGALATGCRYSELARMTIADFDADSKTVAIHITKSGKPRRVILTDEGGALFAQWCAGRAGGEILLLRADGLPWRISQQAEPMRKACANARITPPAGFHTFRHTHGSLLAMRGVPMAVIAAQLGHASTKMTEMHYAHLAPSYVADEIRRGAPRFGFKSSHKVVALG